MSEATQPMKTYNDFAECAANDAMIPDQPLSVPKYPTECSTSQHGLSHRPHFDTPSGSRDNQGEAVCCIASVVVRFAAHLANQLCCAQPGQQVEQPEESSEQQKALSIKSGYGKELRVKQSIATPTDIPQSSPTLVSPTESSTNHHIMAKHPHEGNITSSGCVVENSSEEAPTKSVAVRKRSRATANLSGESHRSQEAEPAVQANTSQTANSNPRRGKSLHRVQACVSPPSPPKSARLKLRAESQRSKQSEPAVQANATQTANSNYRKGKSLHQVQACGSSNSSPKRTSGFPCTGLTFPQLVHRMVTETAESNPEIIEWIEDGEAFRINDTVINVDFAKHGSVLSLCVTVREGSLEMF